jgi:hypothetical protein
MPVVLLSGFDQVSIPSDPPASIREVVKKPVSQRMLRHIVGRIFEPAGHATSLASGTNIVPLALAPA